mmetsp:Transcript_16566/g.49790  ORF Transcript_16566/g.49790 Transcript_16566/m.49790 type:complete len:243 (-) Transcript_16566:1204-1932(-)
MDSTIKSCVAPPTRLYYCTGGAGAQILMLPLSVAPRARCTGSGAERSVHLGGVHGLREAAARPEEVRGGAGTVHGAAPLHAGLQVLARRGHRPASGHLGQLCGVLRYGFRRGRRRAVREREPLVREGLLDRQAALGVHSHQLPDELLGLLGHLGPLADVELVLPLQDLLIEPVLLEGWEAAEHDVEDHAEAPHVRLRPVARGQAALLVPEGVDHLRREVVRGAAEGLAVLALHVPPRQPEVR